AACPPGYLSRVLRETVGPVCVEDAGAALCPTRGQPAAAPGRCARLLGLPDVDDVAERHAAEAGRRRIDGPDALRFDRAAPGCARPVCSACRPRVVPGAAAPRLLDALRAPDRAPGWLPARGRPRTDAPPGLAPVRAGTRVAGVVATRRPARTRWAP